MDKRAQTTFEYLLLVAGVVVLALIVIALLTANVENVVEDVNKQVFSAMDSLRDLYDKALSKLKSLP